MQTTERRVETAYEILVQKGPERWSWTLSEDGAITAGGEAGDPESAQRCGDFAAAAVAALARIHRRRF